MLDDYDNKPDWELWEDEDLLRYLIRLASQVVWQVGVLIDRAAALRDNAWLLSDWLLNTAYPPRSGEVDLQIPGLDASAIAGEFPWGIHGSPEDPT